MIKIITGVPGEGKSLYATHLLVEELIDSNRHVVTNLPLNLEKLNLEFLKRYDVDCISDRITIVDDSQLTEIFTLEGLYPTEGRFFVLDEAQIPFNSRNWAKTGEGVLFYLSQHRKLGDDVICITQSAGNLDKQFRSVAQSFVRCRNHSTKRAGVFRGRKRFNANYFETELMKGEVSYSNPYVIDWRADLYDTASGTGIKGTNADKNKKLKGISIWWGVLLAVLVVAASGAIPFLLGKFAPKLIMGDAVQAPVDKTLDERMAEVLPGELNSDPVVPGASYYSESYDEPEPVSVTGSVRVGSRMFFILSTGFKINVKDVQLITSDGVTLKDGSYFPRRLPVSVDRQLEIAESRQLLRIAQERLKRPVTDELPVFTSKPYVMTGEGVAAERRAMGIN